MVNNVNHECLNSERLGVKSEFFLIQKVNGKINI